MRIYFGEVSDADINSFGTDGLFEVEGAFYSGGVEVGSNPGGFEDVMIFDGCNRRVPISTDNIEHLIKALTECLNVANTLREAEDLHDFAANEDNAAVICEHGHIHW